MLLRRLLALYLTVCVAVGFVTAPAGASVRLVCRMTGRVMPAILRAEGAPQSAAAQADAKRLPCCVVSARPSTAGGVRFALANRSCCDLRIRAAHSPLPPALPAAASSSPIATLPAATAVPLQEAAAVPGTLIFSMRHTTPRAPPLPSRSPRAPPSFS